MNMKNDSEDIPFNSREEILQNLRKSNSNISWAIPRKIFSDYWKIPELFKVSFLQDCHGTGQLPLTWYSTGAVSGLYISPIYRQVFNIVYGTGAYGVKQRAACPRLLVTGLILTHVVCHTTYYRLW